MLRALPILVLLGLYGLSTGASAQNSIKKESKWHDALSHRLSQILNDGQNQKMTLDLYNAARGSSARTVQEYEYFNRTQTFGRREELRSFIKTVSEKEVGRLLGLDAFKSGLNFSFSFSKKPAAAPAAARTADTVRYGLVLQDIEPSDQSLLMAAHNQNDLAVAQTAPTARVKWQIKRLPKTVAKSYQYHESKQVELSLRQQLWQQLTAADFKGKVSIDPNTKASGVSALPGQIITLYQDKGFYSFQAKSNKNFKLSEETHIMTFKLRETTIQSHWDADFKQQKLSFLNWSQVAGWTADLHYLPVADRFQQEMSFVAGAARYGLKAETKSLNPGHLADDRNKLELNLAWHF